MTKTNKILRWTIGVVSVLSLAISFYVFSKCTDVIDKSRKKDGTCEIDAGLSKTLTMCIVIMSISFGLIILMITNMSSTINFSCIHDLSKCNGLTILTLLLPLVLMILYSILSSDIRTISTGSGCPSPSTLTPIIFACLFGIIVLSQIVFFVISRKMTINIPTSAWSSGGDGPSEPSTHMSHGGDNE
mgnify:CR=1 FL=1|tara:strand:- start:156 stop:716 length:561 start_codon:yes stop_codon:yes gene_type:complete